MEEVQITLIIDQVVAIYKETKQFGYNRTEFLRQTAISSNGEKLLKDGKEVYYYLHDKTACYYCVVNASSASTDALDRSDRYYNSKLLAYYKALAREKYNLVKLSSYVNESETQN